MSILGCPPHFKDFLYVLGGFPPHLCTFHHTAKGGLASMCSHGDPTTHTSPHFPCVSEGIFRVEDAVPMEAQPIAPNGLTLEGGFEWHHGGYEKKNAGMQAVRAFTPPCTIRCVVWDRASCTKTPRVHAPMHHAPCTMRPSSREPVPWWVGWHMCPWKP